MTGRTDPEAATSLHFRWSSLKPRSPDEPLLYITAQAFYLFIWKMEIIASTLMVVLKIK